MARTNATSRHIRPRSEHQRVEAVVLGAAAHHHQEGGFERALARVEIDRAAVASSQQHVVQPGVRRPSGAISEGALIDHAEAHVFQHRHALGQRQRAAEAPDLQADRRCSSAPRGR